MKKRTKLLSLILAVLLLVLAFPVTAFAAPRETYLKDLRISTAPSSSSAAAAKKWLTDNGYTVIDANLNEKSGRDYVYVGYITTTDPDEAITDISLMQMDGGYSFSEYEKMVEKKRAEIDSIIDSFAESITEARANYAAGSKGALAAYNIFSYFNEDDSGKTLAELFFGESAPDKATLNKIFLQGNSTISDVIYGGLALACTDYDTADSWLTKLAGKNPYGEYDDLLYNDIAYYAFESFAEINEALREYIDHIKPTVDSIVIEEGTSLEDANDMVPTEYAQEMMLYDTLASYTYNGKPLLDFFLQDPDEIDLDEFYPLLDSMTTGQRAILKFVGLRSLISFADGDDEGVQYYEDMILSVFYDMDLTGGISVYFGVDRSLFDGGVALTTASLRKSASTGDNSWYSESNLDPAVSIALRSIQGVAAMTMLAMPIWKKAAMNVARAEATVVRESTLQSLKELHNMVGLKKNPDKIYSKLLSGKIDNPSQRAVAVTITEQADEAGKAAFKAAKVKITTVARTVMGIAAGIMLIAEGIAIGMKVYKYYNDREYTDIPRIMVDEVLTDTDSYYVNYYAVKDQTGESGDLNAWNAKKWNALYTTTDKRAGDPIIASSFTVQVKNSVFPSDDHGAVHYFGETAAANVNRYQFKSTAPAIYVFYKRDHSLSLTASTFTGGEIVMYTGFGLIGGIAIGSVGAIGAGKLKKKKEADAES